MSTPQEVKRIRVGALFDSGLEVKKCPSCQSDREDHEKHQQGKEANNGVMDFKRKPGSGRAKYVAVEDIIHCFIANVAENPTTSIRGPARLLRTPHTTIPRIMMNLGIKSFMR